jgi:hypothetical protein
MNVWLFHRADGGHPIYVSDHLIDSVTVDGDRHLSLCHTSGQNISVRCSNKQERDRFINNWLSARGGLANG